MSYPEGTPPHTSQVLTDHIKTCEKHPLRKAEEDIKKLRSALSEFIGANTREELESMELIMRTITVSERDRILALNAIHALLDTIE